MERERAHLPAEHEIVPRAAARFCRNADASENTHLPRPSLSDAILVVAAHVASI